MWFQRAGADLKCLTRTENKVVQVVVEEELEHVSCGAAIRLAVEFIEPTTTADIIKTIVNRAGD